MKNNVRAALVLLLTLAAVPAWPSGNFTVAPLFSDHMVLQRESDVVVWGWAWANSPVRIVGSWAPNDTVRVITDGEGRFEGTLRTGTAGGPYTLEVIGENDRRCFSDILLGEVWICSGQSNMQMSAEWGIADGEREAAAADHPNIRIYEVACRGASTPQLSCEGAWEVCTPRTMKRTSAVGYFFARELMRELDVPVGIIVSSWSGTNIEAWLPAEQVRRANPDYFGFKAGDAGKSPVRPGVLYNWMICPLAPYTVAGAIWYQGENNAWGPDTYGQTLRLMIETWRERFRREFPFYLVQIAPYCYEMGYPGAALLREQQEWVTKSVPRTGMVVISDLTDDVRDIHPKNKRGVGVRLARLALSDTYGRELGQVKSPTFGSVTFRGGKAYVRFSDAPGGIRAVGKEIRGLHIVAADDKWYPARGRIRNGELIVWSPSVKQPKAVAYCFDEATIGNLFSVEGLPVAPFRSDREF